MTVRVGVVGAGRWAVLHHIPALLADPRAELVAVCDRPERLAAVRERFGVPHGFTGAAELAGSGLVDAVVVASPPAHHHEAAAAALDAGLHVLVEKPLTVQPADAWDLVGRARRAGCHLLVGYTLQFTEHAVAARQLVAGGQLGDLLLVTAVYTSAMEHLYEGTWPADRGGDPLAQPAPETFADPALAGGGQGYNQASHAVASLLHTSGAEVATVAAHLRAHGRPLDVAGALLLDFAGGASGTLTTTGTLGRSQPVQWWLRYDCEGGAVLHDLAAGELVAHTRLGERVVVPPLGAGRAYPAGAPARRLVDLALGVGSNPAPGELGARATEVVAAAYASAAAGGAVLPVATREPEAAPR